MLQGTAIALILICAPTIAVMLCVLTYVAGQVGWSRALVGLLGGTLILVAWLTGLHWVTVAADSIKF